MFQKSKKVVNFSPGPAKIPEWVLNRAQYELHEYENTGVSILEISHRAKEFDDLLNKTKQNLRDVMGIPQNYQILFLQGGGTGQFAGVPLNLKSLSKSENPLADYMVTGSWSAKASKEAEKFLNVNKVLNPALKSYTTIPESSQWSLSKDAAYVYYCSNETIEGVEFKQVPEIPTGVPLVADISSNALSEPVNVSKHGLLFAGTQKNLGTSGLTIVVVRDDLIGHAERTCPSVFDYKVIHQANSVFNTPPVFNIYVANLVLEWLKDIGGLEEIGRRNEQKAKLIYDAIENSNGFYYCPVDKNYRSRMNIPFRIGSNSGNEELEKKFLKGAEEKGMISLKGYRTVGGVRVSLYNAVTIEETNGLAEFMNEFYASNQHEY